MCGFGVLKNGDKKRFEQYINGVEHGDFLEYDSLEIFFLKEIIKWIKRVELDLSRK